MTGVILRGLAARKARALLTALSVVLGVAMIAGTLVLMDTIMSAYSTVFGAAYAHTDAVVVAQSPFGATGTAKPGLPNSLLTRIRALPVVWRAHGYIDSHAQLTDAAGTPVGKASQEASLFGIPTGELDAMNPLTLISGRWPAGPGQLIVDQATATANHLRIGTAVGLVARQPLQHFRVVGIFRFGGATALGPAQFLAVDLPVAQRLSGKQGMVDEIDVAARPGVPVPALISAIRGIAPGTAKVTTGADQARTATAGVSQQYDLLRYVLLGFGGIALLVGSFIIVNTMSITVAQRTGELATLRALGASRGQVLASVLGEGGLIGITASLAGLGAGAGFAEGISAPLASSGVRLPAAPLVLGWRTVAASLGAGVAVSVAASLVPGLRAMRTPPVRALSAVAGDAAGRRPRGAVAVSAVLASAGACALAVAVAFGGLGTTPRLLLLAGGAIMLSAGLAGASRRAIGPLTAVTGRPLRPLTGAAGELARENAVRNPGRTAATAATAAALTIGVTVIAFVAVLAQGLRQSTGDSIRSQVSAEYVITSQQDLLAPEVQHALRAAGIASASVRAGTVHVLGANQVMTAVTPADIARFYHFTWAAGSSPASLTRLGGNGVLLASDFAQAHHLGPGATLTVRTTDGTSARLAVRGIYQAPKLAPLLGSMTVTITLFDRSFSTPGDQEVFASPSPGGQAELTRVLKSFTTAQVRTLDGFIASQETPIGTLLNLFYVLLALCVLISLAGIANTLALSIAERTREIGMLRAIGMTRTQLRRMIRTESQIIALIGAAGGIAAGLALAGLTASVLSAWNVGFTIPWAVLAILLLAALLAGTLAGALPARRAARLDPLTAISYE